MCPRQIRPFAETACFLMLRFQGDAATLLRLVEYFGIRRLCAATESSIPKRHPTRSPDSIFAQHVLATSQLNRLATCNRTSLWSTSKRESWVAEQNVSCFICVVVHFTTLERADLGTMEAK